MSNQRILPILPVAFGLARRGRSHREGWASPRKASGIRRSQAKDSSSGWIDKRFPPRRIMVSPRRKYRQKRRKVSKEMVDPVPNLRGLLRAPETP